MRRVWRGSRSFERLKDDPERGKEILQMDESIVITEPQEWDEEEFCNSMDTLISMGSAITIESYINSLQNPDTDFMLAFLLKTPSIFRDVVNKPVLCILLGYHDLDSFPDGIRTELLLWAFNKHLRPKKIPYDSPYIPFLSSNLAEQIFGDRIYNEFEWLLRKIQCCPHQNETFLPLSEFSGALLDELDRHQSELFLENRARSNAAPFLFWIMYHLVEHDICTPAELETLAENFGYDFEVILDYYPPTDCLRIDEILSPPESTAPSETLAWGSF